jgi:hypothetical protein
MYVQNGWLALYNFERDSSAAGTGALVSVIFADGALASLF